MTARLRSALLSIETEQLNDVGPVIPRSDWPLQRRFSTPSLPSLDLMLESLTDLRQASAFYFSDALSQLSERIRSA